MEKMFTHLETKLYIPDTFETLETTKQGLEFLTEQLTAEEKDAEELRQLMSWYEQSPQFQTHFEKMWEQMIKGDAQSSIGAAVAKAMYGENGAYSVTRLEKYASCAYAHFCSTGYD
jgi:ATP-dependent helicase/nuclease subunit B